MKEFLTIFKFSNFQIFKLKKHAAHSTQHVFSLFTHQSSLITILLIIHFSLFTIRSFSQWQQTGVPYGYECAITVMAATDSAIYIGEDPGGVYLSTDDGNSWIPRSTGLSDNNVYCLIINGTKLYAGVEGGIFVSTNQGSNWTSLNNGMVFNYGVSSIAINGNDIIICAYGAGLAGGIYISTNNGNNWTYDDNGIMVPNNVQALAVNDSNLVAGLVSGGLYYSTNSGSKWFLNTEISSTSSVINFTKNDNNIFAATDGGVYLSTDSGINWISMSMNKGIPKAFEVTSIAIYRNTIFAGTFAHGFPAWGAVFIFKNYGQNWSDISKGLDSNVINSLAISGAYIYAGTSENGVWRRPLSDIGGKTIQGNITYDNKYNSPIKNTKLYLNNSENIIIDSTVTDTVGSYKFNNETNDTYTVQPLITIPWGGVDPVDALLVNRDYIRLYKFTDNLLKQAADVNLDKKINPVDALLINRRYIKVINSFKAGDWIWDNNTVTMNGQNVTLNFKVVCAGDVNGSYVPK